MRFLTIIVLIIIGQLVGLISDIIGFGILIIMSILLFVFSVFTKKKFWDAALFDIFPTIGILVAIKYYKEDYIFQ